MSQKKHPHTPGPWKVDTWNGWLLSAEDVGIVKFDMNRTLLADAKLIAAAPEMLQALEVALEYFERHEICCVAHDDVKEAIKKAKGE